jgi:hypothetical protein
LNVSTIFYAASKVCDVESERLEVSVNVTALPEALATENSGTLTALPNGGIYQWIFCDGTSIENATEPEYLVESLGSYAVIVEVEGCADTSECVEVLITDIQSLKDAPQVLVFPNPAKTELVIQCNNLQLWELYDATGKLVQSGNEQVIQRGNLKSGLYLLMLIRVDGTTSAKRIVWD